uniref:Uncharacterized protein n=1 Tax=Glossina austeni TaxID=7395 RepID=A0A1A9VH84_GLOAU
MWKQNLNGIHKALSVLQEVLKDSNKLDLQRVHTAQLAESSYGMIMTESELKLKRQMKYLGRHRVWYLRSLGHFFANGAPNHFTHVLIDDASQCTETECDCCSSLKKALPGNPVCDHISTNKLN